MTSGAASTAAQNIPGYVVLPLTYVGRSNQATMRATLNDRPTMLLLDTGASGTMLDQAFYKRAQVRSGNAAPGQLPPEVGKKFTANGEPAEIGYVDSFKAGGTDFGKRPVGVMDLASMFARYNNMHEKGALGGLLGEDFLHKYAAIIDWRRHGVYLNVDPSKRLKLGPSLIASGWTAVPMSPTNARQFTVSCTVEGKPVRLIVDTGATFTSFSPGIVPIKNMLYNRDTHGSIGHLSSNTGYGSMIGGDSVIFPARIENWKIGNYEIASSVVSVHKVVSQVLEQESAGEGPVLGLLGCEVLATNNAIIDIAGSTLYLKPSSSH